MVSCLGFVRVLLLRVLLFAASGVSVPCLFQRKYVEVDALNAGMYAPCVCVSCRSPSICCVTRRLHRVFFPFSSEIVGLAYCRSFTVIPSVVRHRCIHAACASYAPTPLAPRAILVHARAGLGSTLIMCRYCTREDQVCAVFGDQHVA